MSPPSDPFDFSGYTSGAPARPAPAGPPGAGGPGQHPQQGGWSDPFADPFGGPAAPPQPGPGQQGQQGLGLGPDPATPALHAERAPTGWLLAAGGTALVGALVAGLLGSGIALAAVGWVLAGPLAIGLLALFTQRDTRARATPVYVTTGWVGPGYWAVLGVVVVAVGLSAWRIAEWAGRL